MTTSKPLHFISRGYYRVISRLHRYVDRKFDSRRNIETSKIVRISDLQDDVDFSDYAIDELYAGTPTCLFNDLHAPVKRKELQNITYIDIGSGKSRILIQAAEAGFDNIIGVEFSPTLAEEGRKNCEKAITVNDVKWDVLTEDAKSLDYPDGDLVIFLYNPFDQAVFNAFLDNLVNNLSAKPRSLVLIYNHAHYAHLLDENTHLKRIFYPWLTRLKLKLFNPHSFGAWEYNFSN